MILKKILGLGFLLYVSAAVVTAFAGVDITGDQSHHAPGHQSTQCHS
jgi:hypothetical protein